MTASELFQAGRLQEAIAAQTAAVKSGPTDQSARFFLFELLLFAGELDRARKQLDVLRYDDPRHAAAVAQYRFALDAEVKRRAVFAGSGQPAWLTAVPDHVRQRLEALPYLARGETAEARRRLDEANAAVPALTGTLDGQPFEGLYDADERFATVLEVFGTGGAYAWVPLEQLTSVTTKPPASPRDIVLRPAHLVTTDGVEGDVLIPGLYPDTHANPDELVNLGRVTEWVGAASGVARGVGCKLFIMGDQHLPFTRLTEVALAPANPGG